MNETELGRLVSEIYAASFEDAAWPEIASRLSALFGDAAIGLDSRSGLDDVDSLAASALFDTSLQALHYEGYDRPDTNPGVAALMRAPLGRPFSLASFVDADTYARDPSIRAILHPQKIDKGLFVTLDRDRSFGFLGVYRRASQEDFGADEVAALATIALHVARSLKLRALERARQRRIEARRLMSLSDRALEGMMVVAADGRILDADPEAEAVLVSGDGLAVRQGRLISTARRAGQDGAALAAFLGAPADGAVNFAIRTASGTVLVLERILLPGAHAGATRLQAVTVRRLSRRVTGDVSAMVQAFGLTRAEGRVLSALTASDSAVAVADALGLSRDTVKTHLARIYRKTGTRSLAQLMLLAGRFL